MIPIVFGLLAALMFGISSLVMSRSAKIIGAPSSLGWLMLVGLTPLLPFLGHQVPDTVPPNLGWMALIGFGNMTGLLFSGFALRVGKVGMVAPIIATEGAIAAVLAALMGEAIAPIVAFLLMLIVAGIVLSAVAPDPVPLPHEQPVLAVALATVSAVCFGLGLFAVGHLSSDLPLAWLLLPARLVGVLVITVPLALSRRLRITRRTVPMVITMGLAELSGVAFFSVGAAQQVAVTSVLASQFAPIAAILAYVIFSEVLGRWQIAGVVILVLGVTSLSLVS